MATSDSNEYCKSDDTTCKDENLQGRLKYVMFTYDSIKDKWTQFASDSSKEDLIDSIKCIYEFRVKSDEFERKAALVEEKLKKSSANVEREIEQLKRDCEELQKKFEEVKNYRQSTNEKNIEEDEEILVFLDPDAPKQVHHKIQFSNNIVRVLQGPLKLFVHGIMGAADLAARGTQIDPSFLEAVRKAIGKQKERGDPKNGSLPPTYVEITPEWQLEGENEDKGFNSPSHWLRDPQRRRVLIKIQQLPLCAANEWLAYALGKELGLPVNEVQIGLYENQLSTFHTDDQNENEKTISFMDLPAEKRDILLVNPILIHMDIFDHIIQNMDRNQQNILLIVPKSVQFDQDQDHTEIPLKVRLIDHASSFGMGKLSGISEIAAKFHSDRLSVLKFDPEKKSREFEDYLTKLPVEDRPIIAEILERFAAITDEQFDGWMAEIQELFSPTQYDRISKVLRRQRDIAKRYAEQWRAAA